MRLTVQRWSTDHYVVVVHRPNKGGQGSASKAEALVAFSTSEEAYIHAYELAVKIGATVV